MIRLSLVLGFLLSTPLLAQTYNTTCTLYPGAAYCTTTTTGSYSSQVAVQQQQQYDAGYAIGAGIGNGIARKMFPEWRRRYCSKHPEQPFYYDQEISGTCPTLDQLVHEGAAEFHAKHPDAVKSPEHAQAIDKYIFDNKLPAWEPKSYAKAAEATDPTKQKKEKS